MAVTDEDLADQLSGDHFTVGLLTSVVGEVLLFCDRHA